MPGKWLRPWEQLLCPFCFNKFSLTQAPLRPLKANRDTWEEDTVLGEFLDLADPPLMPPVIEASPNGQQTMWSQMRLDNRVMSTHDRLCPHCHLPLPTGIATGYLNTNIIAIVGERAAGKSNYFAALIHQLLYGQAVQRAKISMIAQDSYDIDRREKRSSSELWQERYGRYIRGHELDGEGCKVVPPTTSWEVNPEIRTPLIYRLQFEDRGLFHKVTKPFAKFRAMNLVIYDTAGEDIENKQRLQLWYQYLTQAKGLIFLIDPLRLPGVRGQLRRARNQTPASSEDIGLVDHESPNEDASTSDGFQQNRAMTSTIVDSCIDLFELGGLVPPEAPIRTPAAFVFTKADELRPLLPQSSQLLFESVHEGGLDLEDIDRVSQEVSEYMVRWGESGTLAKLKRFSNSKFFAVSALGAAPTASGEIKRYKPSRVADPLFWMLYQLGYLQGTETNGR